MAGSRDGHLTVRSRRRKTLDLRDRVLRLDVWCSGKMSQWRDCRVPFDVLSKVFSLKHVYMHYKQQAVVEFLHSSVLMALSLPYLSDQLYQLF